MPSPPEQTCPLPSSSSIPHHLCYSTFGKPSDPCLLLVMGLATQMLAWKNGFCELLANKGYFVVRFDNRDIGKSSHYDHLGPPPLIRIIAQNFVVGKWCPPKAPYSLADMAEDSFQLLDYLKVNAAHICGVSMGGMIAQTMALSQPSRVLSLCSIMSTPGARNLPEGDLKIRLMLLRKPAPTFESRKASVIAAMNAISHPAVPAPGPLDEYCAEVVNRSYHPVGAARQICAILAQPDRTHLLAELSMPALVLHGRGDRLVKLACGEATAAAIGGDVIFHIVDGMGHALNEQFYDEIVTAIVGNCERVEKGGGGVREGEVKVQMT